MWPLLIPKLIGPVTQFVTGINIGQVLSNLFTILGTAVKFTVKHWQLSLIVGLLLGNIVGFTGWKHDHTSLLVERAAHQLDIKNYKQAQADAQKAADKEKQQVINESKVKATATDNKYHDLLNQYNASLLRYKATQGTTGKSGNSGDDQTGQVTTGSSGPSANANLYITLDDAKICAVNTARLQAAHDWAVNLTNGEN